MRGLYCTAWFVVVAGHLALILGIFGSLAVLPFLTPWYVATPLCVFIVRLIFSRDPCVFTDLENHFRERLGWPKVRGFVGHYIFSPARKLRRAVLARQPKVG